MLSATVIYALLKEHVTILWAPAVINPAVVTSSDFSSNKTKCVQCAGGRWGLCYIFAWALIPLKASGWITWQYKCQSQSLTGGYAKTVFPFLWVFFIQLKCSIFGCESVQSGQKSFKHTHAHARTHRSCLHFLINAQSWGTYVTCHEVHKIPRWLTVCRLKTHTRTQKKQTPLPFFDPTRNRLSENWSR